MRLLNFLQNAQATHAVFGTYAFDPGFYETFVLRHLSAQGCTSQLVLIDQECLTGTLEGGGFAPRFMGTHYLAQGISVPGAFHPKFLLLVSQDGGELLIGSSNLTVPGYTHNDELLVQLSYRPDEPLYMALFQQCWRYVQSCLALQRSSEVVLSHCRQVSQDCPWLVGTAAPAPDTWLLSQPGASFSIARQLAGVLGDEPIRQVIVMAPYFDAELNALARLAKTFPRAEIRVVVQPKRCTVNPGRVPALPRNVRFFDLEDLGRGEEGARFFHAKGILLESRRQSYCLMGSANISFAALYAPPGEGNAELCLLVRHQEPDHFRSVLGITAELGRLEPIDMAAARTAFVPPKTLPATEPAPLLPTAAQRDGKEVCVFYGTESSALNWSTIRLCVGQAAVPLDRRSPGELRFTMDETPAPETNIGRLTCRWRGKDWSSTPFVIHDIGALHRNMQVGRLGRLAGYMRRGSFLSGDLSAVGSLMAELLSGFQPPKSASTGKAAASTGQASSEKSGEMTRVPYEQFLTGSEYQPAWATKAGLSAHSDLDAYLRLVSSSIERQPTGAGEPPAELPFDEQDEEDEENGQESEIYKEEEHPPSGVRASEAAQFQKRFLCLLVRYREELNRLNLNEEPLSLRDMGKLIVIGQTTLFFCCKELPAPLQPPNGKRCHFLELAQIRESLQDILHCWFLSNKGRLIDRVMIEGGAQSYRTAEIEFFLVTVGLLAAALRRASNTSFDRLLVAATHWRSCFHSMRLDEKDIATRARRVITNLGLESMLQPDRWLQTWRAAAGLGRTLAAAHETLRSFGDGAAWLAFNKKQAGAAPQIGDILWNPGVGFTSVSEAFGGNKIRLSTDWQEESRGYLAGNFANLSAMARGSPCPSTTIRQTCKAVVTTIGA
jgi:hypothetical protein